MKNKRHGKTGRHWKLSGETKKRQSEAKIGDKNPSYGKPAYNRDVSSSEQSKLKNRLAHLGKKQSKEIIEKRFAWLKDNNKRLETNKKRSKSLSGRIQSDEHRLNSRKAAINRITRNNGICRPNFNPKACEFFKSYDEHNNTNGQYATSGGEYEIKDLGYFLDYINFDKKLIMEFDEKYHDKRKDKDVIRQKEIQQLYPDFKFIRIKQESI